MQKIWLLKVISLYAQYHRYNSIFWFILNVELVILTVFWPFLVDYWAWFTKIDFS